MKTDEAIALLKAEMLMLAPNGNPISDLYYAVEMAIEALGDRFELNEYRQCGTVEDCRSRMQRIAFAWVVSYCDEGDPEPTVTAFDNLDAAANCKHFFVDAGHQRVSLDACGVYSSFEITSRAPRKGGRHVKS